MWSGINMEKEREIAVTIETSVTHRNRKLWKKEKLELRKNRACYFHATFRSCSFGNIINFCTKNLVL